MKVDYYSISPTIADKLKNLRNSLNTHLDEADTQRIIKSGAETDTLLQEKEKRSLKPAKTSGFIRIRDKDSQLKSELE